eukprot:6528161-Pyramimonas_sp.AAC.1
MSIQLDTTCRDERGHGRYGAYPADYHGYEEEALLGYECGVRDKGGLLSDESTTRWRPASTSSRGD